MSAEKLNVMQDHIICKLDFKTHLMRVRFMLPCRSRISVENMSSTLPKAVSFGTSSSSSLHNMKPSRFESCVFMVQYSVTRFVEIFQISAIVSGHVSIFFAWKTWEKSRWISVCRICDEKRFWSRNGIHFGFDTSHFVFLARLSPRQPVWPSAGCPVALWATLGGRSEVQA